MAEVKNVVEAEEENEAQLAERMMNDIKEHQAEKADRHAQKAADVATAKAHAEEVAANVAAGEVAPAQVSEKVTTAAEFDPQAEAEAGARMIEDLMESKAAKAAKREAAVEAFEQDQFNEAAEAGKVADSVKAAAARFKEKLGL